MKKFWSTSELLRLKEMEQAGLAPNEMAKVLGRTRVIVDKQLYRMRRNGWSFKRSRLEKSQVDEMIELRKQKITYPEIGRRYGVSPNRAAELCRNRRRELNGGVLPGFINATRKQLPYSRERRHLADVPQLSESYRHIFARDKPPSDEEEAAIKAEIEHIKRQINDARAMHGIL